MDNIKEIIDAKVSEYYTNYYKNELGFSDYQKMVNKRLNEDDKFSLIFDKVRSGISFFYKPINKQKILVLGAGTGAEFINFCRMGYDAIAIEPDPKAIEIIKLKCDYYNINKDRVKTAYAENLPFPDKNFDFIWSWTVLEHVQDIRKSIFEIYRVLKINGWVLLVTPETKHFWEGHYKLYLPMFLPKSFNKIILKILGRPTEYFDKNINRITTSKVRNILSHLNFNSYFLYHHWPQEWQARRKLGMNCVYWFTKLTGRQRDQWWILNKIK